MGEIKTHGTSENVDDFIAAIDDEARRKDCLELLALMRRATGEEPRVWSHGVVGFGTYHYASPSGQEGDWFPVGFASRKAALTVYLGLALDPVAEELGALGAHKTGKGCIYIKRLSDVDLGVLERLVGTAYKHVKTLYP